MSGEVRSPAPIQLAGQCYEENQINIIFSKN